jgi:integrase/recombinase XerD
LKENGLLEDIYLTPRGIERARRSWLRPWISPYFDSLVDRKYRKSTLAVYANRLLSFGEFLEQRGACDIVDVRRWVEPFLQQRGLPAHRTRNWRSTLDRFVRDLVRQQAIPAPASPPPVCPHIELVEDYACFLREQRGAGREGLSLVRRHCSALLIHLAAQGISDLSTLTPPVIHGFITDQGQRYARKTLTHICSSVRGFLTYLYRRRVVPRDLGPVVVAPRLFRHEQCPRFLTRPEVEAVLATIDRQEARGRRDYAMVLLLATYGLRGIEVVRLRLDDIDWRGQKLHIRKRKAGNHSIYPLTGPVGDALLSYLRHGRPDSTHREVFLTFRAPFLPLAPNGALYKAACKSMTLAGVRVERPGTHTFRYSCAQRLVEHGLPLKSVADYLGHQDVNTTYRYTMIAIDQLRDVASGDGEDLL